MRVGALESLQTPCHQPHQKLQIYCGALERHLILLTVYLMCVCHCWFCLRTRSVRLFFAFGSLKAESKKNLGTRLVSQWY